MSIDFVNVGGFFFNQFMLREICGSTHAVQIVINFIQCMGLLGGGGVGGGGKMFKTNYFQICTKNVLIFFSCSFWKRCERESSMDLHVSSRKHGAAIMHKNFTSR